MNHFILKDFILDVLESVWNKDEDIAEAIISEKFKTINVFPEPAEIKRFLQLNGHLILVMERQIEIEKITLNLQNQEKQLRELIAKKKYNLFFRIFKKQKTEKEYNIIKEQLMMQNEEIMSPREPEEYSIIESVYLFFFEKTGINDGEQNSGNYIYDFYYKKIQTL